MERKCLVFYFLGLKFGRDPQSTTQQDTSVTPEPGEADEEKSVVEREKAFRELRAEENRQIAAAYREAAARMLKKRIDRLGAANDTLEAS